MTYTPVPEQAPQQLQAKAKKPIYKRVWFIILAAIGVIAIGSNLGEGTEGAGGAQSTTSTDGGAVNSAAPALDAPVDAANPGIGEPAADGKFTFVVNGVDCSTTKIGNEFLNATAQGQYCIVDLTVTNIGNEAQGFFGDNAKLFNAQGQEFSADGEAAIYLEDSSSLYEEINPGNTLKSKVVFDVPVGTTPTTVELHDWAFSGGVTVDLQ